MVEARLTPMSRSLSAALGNLTSLRVAFLAGSLVQGGAEKQLVYMARALKEAGVTVRVFALTQGDYYDAVLRDMGIAVEYVPRGYSPARRLAILVRQLRLFRPHIVQSAQFFTNLYAALGGCMSGAVAIGSMRSDLHYEMARMGFWGKWLARMPRTVFANSHAARRNAAAAGMAADRMHLLENVIDLQDFDRRSDNESLITAPEHIVAVAVGALEPVKRFDRFIRALAKARQSEPALRGWIVGAGPERSALERTAKESDPTGDGILFLGERSDVPALLKKAHMLVLCSDHEGFPNVVMEAMAARLPVIATPAGDCGALVDEGVTGCLVPFDDVSAMAARMVQLAAQPAIRERFGAEARRIVEERYSYSTLADRLLALYRKVGAR